MEAKRMPMSSCGTQWMLCKSPAYLEPSEFYPKMCTLQKWITQSYVYFERLSVIFLFVYFIT